MIVSSQNTFFEVSSSILTSNERCGFDLFVKTGSNYVLFASKQLPIAPTHLGKIQNEHISSLFVKKSEEKVYREYLCQSLSKFATDRELEREAKAKFMYETARAVMMDLFEQPEISSGIDAVKDATYNVIDTILGDDKAFASLVKVSSCDHYIYTHSINAMVYSIGLGKKIGLPQEELNNLALGAVLHDVGKSKIPAQILNKPDKLTSEEFKLIESHTVVGKEILEGIGVTNKGVIEAVKYHHEKLDGSGYPKGLKSDGVPLNARIVAIADIFDALNSNRYHKDGISSFEALQLMKTMNEHIDIKLLNNFILCMSGR